MKRAEEIYNELLFWSMEKKKSVFTQSELSKKLKISLSLVNKALEPLKRMNAITVQQRNFRVIDKKKILYYWASIRNIEKDIIYKTRVNTDIKKIENSMPSTIIYCSYSAYKFMFKDVPADYSEVYVYGDDLDELKKRFPQNTKIPNLFVLKKTDKLNTMSIANIFVDLWNMKEWYAKDFLKAMEEKINGLLE